RWHGGNVLRLTVAQWLLSHTLEILNMKAIWLSTVLFCTSIAAPAQTPEKSDTVPIFHVTVVQSTISAINYQYRQGPTKIDFKGTVLMPEAKGEAIVESK